MDMVTRYLTSTKPRASNARNIPSLAVNFIDTQNIFQDQWKNNVVRGNPTSYTSKALAYYDEELNNILLTDSFIPIEPGINLNEWNPKNKYFIAGAPGFSG